MTEAEYQSFTAFSQLPPEERLKASREIVTEFVIKASIAKEPRFPLAVKESESLLQEYATLDDVHRAEIKQLIHDIRAYLDDATRKRPFNALMLASPGAGKSHFIKRLAAAMDANRVQAVTFNMATMQSADDMEQPIDQLRNLKVNDRFPLLFLDEFDSDPARYPSLLPLLWDGELQVGHRDLKLGKAVIVLAGSTPDLPKTMAYSAAMGLEPAADDKLPSGKLVDLLSRINGGVIKIPDLDLRTPDRDRRIDKICVLISLLRARFGRDLTEVPRSLLRFVAHTAFRYHARSMAHLVDLIDSAAFVDRKLDREKLGLPLNTEAALSSSNLSLHLLDKDKGFGIVSRWKEFDKDPTVASVDVRDRVRLPLFSYLSA